MTTDRIARLRQLHAEWQNGQLLIEPGLSDAEIAAGLERFLGVITATLAMLPALLDVADAARAYVAIHEWGIGSGAKVVDVQAEYDALRAALAKLDAE